MSDSEGVWSVLLQDCAPSAASAALAAAMETFGLEGASGDHHIDVGPVRLGFSRTCAHSSMGKLTQSSFKLNS